MSIFSGTQDEKTTKRNCVFVSYEQKLQNDSISSGCQLSSWRHCCLRTARYQKLEVQRAVCLFVFFALVLLTYPGQGRHEPKSGGLYS